MVHTLTAFQEQKDVLINTMDVFIKEPLLDWEKLARKLAREQSGGAEDNVNVWFPKQKIDIAKRKLNRENPAYITVAELKESIHASAPYFKSLQQIVLGETGVNIRASVKEKCTSTKEQVDCLVEQATDPNLVGRTYNGAYVNNHL